MASFFASFTPQYRRAVATLLLIVGLAVAQWFLWPAVARQARHLQVLRSHREQLTTVNSHIEAMQQSLATHQQHASRLAAIAPAQDNLLPVVERLELLADQRGLSLTISSIAELPNRSAQNASGESAAPVFIETVMSLTASGNVNALLNYLTDIEHASELNYVRDFSLKPAATAQAPAEQAYQLTAEVVFLVTPGTARRQP